LIYSLAPSLWINKMESALSSACLEKIRAASKPMSLSEISAACLGRKTPNAEIIEALRHLIERKAIHEWPTYRKSRLFSGRPLRNFVEDAFVAVLDAAPLTVSKAAKPVSQAVTHISEANTLAELRAAAPKLAAAQRIVQVPISRQLVVYISPSYLGRLAPTKPNPQASNTLDNLIVAAVKDLESGPGNFVAVDELRRSRAINNLVDATVISLADEGRLILGRYGGPRPDGAVEKSRYLEDQSGQLFIGIALPRND
jgi:hypothetical protein